MQTLDWSKIIYKNPAPTTLEFTGKNVIDKRFDNYCNNYSEEQLEMLQYFKKFAITSTIYDNKNPWTLLEAQGQEDNATHKIYKENFKDGTFRIIKPGYYELQDDVVFSPDPKNDDSFMPTQAQINAGDYPTASTNPTGYYHMGFFAAITVETDGVVLNLNGHTIKQSEIHKLQQRFFACIELASAPFIQAPTAQNPNNSTGPSQFGPTPISAARNTYICNGKLLTSSHHGIHANNTVNVVIENLTIANFEVGGIQLNGGINTIIRNIQIANGSDDVRVNATYSQAKFLLRFLNNVDDSVTLNLSSGSLTKAQIINKLTTAMKQIQTAVKEKQPLPTTGDAAIFTMNGDLIDGNRYGIVVAQKGPVVGPFKLIRSATGANESIIIHDITIENLSTKPQEILACSTDGDHNPGEAYGGARAVDAVGGIIRMLDIKGGAAGPGSYKPNVLSNAQLLVAVMGQSNPSWDRGKTNIPKDLINWALAGTNTLDSVINGVKYYYVGLGDSMGHHMKGDQAIFMQGAKNCKIFNILIKEMKNNSLIGTEFKQYPAYLESPGLYLGGSNTGVTVVASENIELSHLDLQKIESVCGIAQGIQCLGANKKVSISDYKICEILCGKPSLQGEDPNPAISCNFISIDKECYDEVSCGSLKF